MSEADLPPDPTTADAVPPRPDDPAAEGDVPADVPGGKPAGASPKPTPRKRRRWRWVVGSLLVLLLLLGLLIVLAPTLAGMGWARAIVVGQINKHLNGRVEIADYSVGWTGGMTLRGVKVFDANDSEIFEIGLFKTQLTLLKALRGRYDLGETEIRRVGFTVKRYADGTTNIDRLLKEPEQSPATPVNQGSPAVQGGQQAPTQSAGETGAQKEGTKGEAPKGPRLPPVSGHIVLAECHGVFDQEARAGEPAGSPAARPHVVVFDTIEGDVKIPDINSPIDNDLKVVARADNAAPGTLTAKGSVGLVQDNFVDPAAANVKETVDLANFDLGAAGMGLPRAVKTLAGIATGNVSLDVSGGKAGTVGASLDVQKPVLALKAFEADESLPLDHFNFTLPPTAVDMSAGPEQWEKWAVRVGDGRTQQLSIAAEKDGTKLLNVTVAADATAGELKELAANRKLGGTGRVDLIAHADVGRIARLLPKTIQALHVRDDVEVDSGQFQYTLAADLAPASSKVNQTVDLSDVKGRNTKENKPVSLQPIHLAFDGSSFGGGWQVPDLRQLSLVLGYGKALTGEFKGETLSTVNGKLEATLQDVLADAGQFYDFKGKTASGKLTVNVKAEGNLAAVNSAGASTLHLAAAVADLKTRGFVGPSPDSVLAEPLVSVDAGAEVNRDADGTVSALKHLKLAAFAGDAARHTLDADVEADEVQIAPTSVTDPKTGEVKSVKVPVVPRFAVRKLDVPDLRQAQAEFGSLVSALQGLQIERGSLSVAGGGGYDGVRQLLSFQLSAKPEGLTLLKLPAAPTTQPSTRPVSPQPAPVEIISGYSLPSAITGTYGPDRGVPKLVISALSIKDNKQWLSIDKASNEIQILLPPDGPPQAQGTLKLAANLAAWNDVSRKVSGGAEDPSAMKLVSAMLEGTVQLDSPPAPAPAGSTGVAGDFGITQLTIAGGQGAVPGLQNESIRITLRSVAEAGFSRIKVSQLDAVGSVLTAHVPSAELWLRTGSGREAKPVPTLQKLRQLTASVEVPDAGKLQALLDALSPPAKPAAAATATPAAPAAASRPKLTAGSFVIKFDATNEHGQLTIKPDVRGSALALASGAGSYPMGDVAFSAKIFVVADPAAQKPGPNNEEPKLAEQIRQLQVPEFAADVAGTSLRLDGAPITVSDPAYLSAVLGPEPSPDTRPATAPATPAVPPGKTPRIDAALLATGDLKKLTNLLDVLGGRPPQPNYEGVFTLHQKVAIGAGGWHVTGNGVLQNFVALGADHVTPAFTEKAVLIEDFLSLTNPPAPAGAPAGAEGQPSPLILSIGKLSLVMDSSKAGSVVLTGVVRDPMGEREFENVFADVTYDWAQLWPILHPMLAPKPDPAAPKGTPSPVDKLKDLKIAGKGTQRFIVSGKFPARLGDDPNPVPFNKAVSFLNLQGGVGIDLLDVQGIHVEHLALPLDLRNGVLSLADATKPAGQNFSPPAACNGGTVNLGSAAGVLSFDLTAEDPRVSGPKGLKLFDRVTLNPILTDFLGGFINNPLLVDPKQSSGVLTLTIDQLNRMPMDKLAMLSTPANDGRCDMDLSLTGLQLGNPLLAGILQGAGQGDAMKSMRGDVRKYHVSFQHGIMTQDFNMDLLQRKLPLRLFGQVRLADQRLIPVTLNLPTDFFQKVARGANLERILPNGFELPLTGTVRQPQFDLGVAVQRNITDNLLKNPLQELPGLINPKKEDKGNKPGQPAKPGQQGKSKEDPLGVIGDLINDAAGGKDGRGKPPTSAPTDGRRP